MWSLKDWDSRENLYGCCWVEGMWTGFIVFILDWSSLKSIKSCRNDDELHSIKNVNLIILYFRWGNEDNKLIGKIGIHYGNAISGVIGFHKP